MSKKKPPRQKHAPQRTCAACRQKREKRRLTRIVRTPAGAVVVDPSGKQNGRGTYLCDQAGCWDKAISDPNVLGRVLKTAVSETDRMAIAEYQPVNAAEEKANT